MLFGHQNDDNNPAGQNDAAPAAPELDTLANDATVVAPPAHSGDLPDLSLGTVPADDAAASDDTSNLTVPDTTVADDHVSDADVPAATPTNVAASGAAPSAAVPSDLLSLKQQALEQLGPLVDHLDQSPQEKFRTTMMMIQSADNQALIPVAYQAAQNIPEEKARAQALLDVVNEINYFTQKDK